MDKNNKDGINNILQYIYLYKVKFICYLLCIVTAMIAQMVQPLIFGKIVDSISSANYQKIFLYILIVGAIYTIGIVVNFIKSYIIARLSNLIEVDIKNRILSNILRLPIEEYEAIKKGEFITKLEDDVGAISGILVGTIPNIIIDISSLIIVGAILFKINWILTLLLLITFPLSYFIFNIYGLKIKEKNIKLKNEKDSYFTIIEEILSGLKTIRIFNAENIIGIKFKNQLDSIYKIGMSRAIINSCGEWISGLINMAEYIILLLISIYEIRLGKLTLGSMVAFTTYSNTFSNSLLGIIQFNPKMKDVSVSIERISNLISKYNVQLFRSQNVNNDLDLVNRVIEFKDVSFKYNNCSSYVLNKLNLYIESKKITAIIGLNGSGKSSIFNLITGLYDNYQGDILIGDINYSELDKNSILKKCALVTQESFLLSCTIKENLLIGNLDSSQEEIENSCKMVNLHEFIISLPNKYETKIGYDGIQLSGGQKQRLSIARAILKKAEVYLFDEVTSSIDGESKKYIHEVIKKLSKTNTVIMISHKQEDIDLADNIISIENGQVVRCEESAVTN